MKNMDKKKLSKGLAAFLLLCCTMLAGACMSTAPSNTLYTLYATEKQSMNENLASLQEMILVMPIRMAPQLQNRGLLYQYSAGEAKSAANHLWAGPLNQQITDTLVSNIKTLLRTDNVAAFPGPRYGNTLYQVEVEVHEFSGNSDFFSIEAVYTISNVNLKIVLERKTFQQKKNNIPAGYGGYVNSASLSLGELSRQIAGALVRVQNQKKSTPKSRE